MANVGNANVKITADDKQARSTVSGFSGFLSSSFKGMAGVVAGIGVFTGIVDGLKSVVVTGATYEATMSKVQAVTRSSSDEMARMDQLAKELGESTRFSASEAAEGMAFLGQAGFDTNQIIAAMPGLLSLAAAGGLDLGRAADIASNVLSGFNLEADQMGRVSDVMALSAATANTSVEQLGMAMSYVAPVASGAGLSMEEVAASIGVLSNSGIQGERAGTALRGMIASLQNPTGQTKEALDKLGLTMGAVNPTTNSLAEILGYLERAGIDSATAMQLVGVEAGPALISLLNTGSKGLESYTAEMNNAKGAADQMAATMNDNLIGAWDEFTSKVETIGLTLYERALPALTAFVAFITAAASAILANMGPALDYMGQLLSNIWPIVQILGGALIAAFSGLAELLAPFIKGLADVVLAFTGWEGFVPIVTGLITALTGLFIANKVAAGIKLLRGAMLIFMNPLARAILMTGLWRKAMTLLSRVFLLNPFTIAIAAIVALGVALVTAYKRSETFREFINGLAASISAAWSETVAGFVEIWNRIVAAGQETASAFAEIWGRIVEGAKQTGAGFQELWNRIVLGAQQTMAAFGTIGAFFAGIWAQIVSAAQQTGVAFAQLWAGIVAGFQSFVVWIQGLLAPFVAYFVQSWENLKLLVLSIVTGFLSLLTGDFEGMRLAVLGIVTALKNQAIALWTLFKNTGLALFRSLLTGAVNLFNNLKDRAIAIFNQTKDSVVKAVQALYTGAINLIKNLYTGAVNWFNNMRARASEISQNMKNAVVKAVQALYTGAINLIRNLYNGVVNWFNNMRSSATNTVNNMKTAIINAFNNAKENAINAVRNLYNSVRDWLSKVVDRVQQMKDDMISKIKSIDLAQYGRDAIQGFINGIAEKISAVKTAAGNVVDSLKNKLAEKLKLGSPSKLFAQYGEWTFEGFVNGAEGMIGKVRDIAGKISSAAVPSMAGAENAINGLKNMSSNGAFNISGMLSAAGGMGGDTHNHYWNVKADEINDVQKLIGVINGVTQAVRSR